MNRKKIVSVVCPDKTSVIGTISVMFQSSWNALILHACVVRVVTRLPDLCVTVKRDIQDSIVVSMLKFIQYHILYISSSRLYYGLIRKKHPSLRFWHHYSIFNFISKIAQQKWPCNFVQFYDKMEGQIMFFKIKHLNIKYLILFLYTYKPKWKTEKQYNLI